jgi:hypothetical protein
LWLFTLGACGKPYTLPHSPEVKPRISFAGIQRVLFRFLSRLIFLKKSYLLDFNGNTGKGQKGLISSFTTREFGETSFMRDSSHPFFYPESN